MHDTFLHHIDCICHSFSLHQNSLANAEFWRCIFICRVRFAIHIIVIQFPEAKSFNSPSDVSPSISFRRIRCIWCVLSAVNTLSHNLCGSCDLASKLHYVTGDELDIGVSIALSESKHYYAGVVSFVWIFFICLHTDLVTVHPSPAINYTLQQEDTTVVKKFQHILGLCSSS